MMKRQHDHPPMFLGLVLSLLFVLAFAIPAAGNENSQVSTDPALGQVVLRQNIIVDNTLVMLGDFFDGAGEKATVAVA
ncbi:MAG: hypothetical protein H8E36_13600, partial [Rhodospirillaceae bacterium]|nr:hypothetical protein [Rhodospirillaceae bacterium]